MSVAAIEDLRAGDRVAIVEDDEANARALGWTLEDLDLEPVLMTPDPKGVETLIECVKRKAVAAISDHRLGKRRSIPYYGAEFVAKSNQRKLPAVLITSYANSDESTSIRAWRADIPRLLNRGTDVGDPSKIRSALDDARAECMGLYTEGRRAYPTIVRLVGLRSGPSGRVAEVVVTAWRPGEAIDIPAKMLTVHPMLSRTMPVGLRVVADVNIYAKHAGDLYFRNIRPAPNLPLEWKLS